MPRSPKVENPCIKKAYMCGVDWQHELEHFDGGVKAFPSLKSLEENHPCLEECGAIEVSVKLEKWVIKQKL